MAVEVVVHPLPGVGELHRLEEEGEEAARMVGVGRLPLCSRPSSALAWVPAPSAAGHPHLCVQLCLPAPVPSLRPPACFSAAAY